MEKLNLYTYKKRKLKWSTFIILMIFMVLPGLSVKFYLEMMKKETLENITIQYSKVITRFSINLTYSKKNNLEELARADTTLSNMITALTGKYEKLVTFYKDWVNSKRFLHALYKNWSNDVQKGWLILKDLAYDSDSATLSIYEVYSTKRVESPVDKISKDLEQFYEMKNEVLFDSSILMDLRVRKVRLIARQQER